MSQTACSAAGLVCLLVTACALPAATVLPVTVDPPVATPTVAALPTHRFTATPPATLTPTPTAPEQPRGAVVPPMVRATVTPTRERTPVVPTPAVTITVIYDNHPGDARLQTAWGFASLVEGLEQTILFDTGGDGALLLRNMRALGVAPGQIDVVVLSHSHQDHTGGLVAFLAENSDVTVYMPTSLPQALKDAVLASGADLVAVSGPSGVCAGVSVTGELGSSPKEIGLLVEGPDGMIVITGCAHPGIVEIVRQAKAVTGLPVELVLGGFHLGNESAARIGAVVEALMTLGVRRVAPGHCSGDMAIRLFEQAFGPDFIRIGAGSRVSGGREDTPTATPRPRR